MAPTAQVAALASLALQVGCAVSAGSVAAGPPAELPSLAGPSAEAQLYLPPDFRAIAGLEFTRAGTARSLWRTGLLAGYSSSPDGTHRFGWETTARAGYQRSWDVGRTVSGAFAGGGAAALCRLGGSKEAWQGDPLFEAIPTLVFDLAVNGLTRSGGPMASEFTARLMLRVHLTSTVIP